MLASIITGIICLIIGFIIGIRFAVMVFQCEKERDDYSEWDD